MTMEVYVKDALLILVFVFPRTCGSKHNYSNGAGINFQSNRRKYHNRTVDM